MGVEMIDSYHVRCDFPGCRASTGSLGEYGAYGSPGEAEEDWREMEGYVGPLGAYCPEHTIYDPDEDGDDDDSSYRPMLPTLDNMFVLAERRIADRIERSARRALDEHARRIRSWELADASIERRVRVRLGDGGWHDLRAYSHTLVDATRRAAEAVRGG